VHRQAKLCAVAVVGLSMLGITGCGGLPISLFATPNPALLSKPLTFTVGLQNTLACNAVDPLIVFIPLVDETPEFTEVCQFLAENNLDPICMMIDDPMQAAAAADQCCRFTDFQDKWGDAVCGALTTGSLRDRLQSFPLQDSLAQHSIQSHADFTASATSALGALSCSTTTVDGFPALDCSGNTLAPGDTATATLTVTPTMAGHFGTLAISFANASCGINKTAEGAVCLSTEVTASRATAPLLPGRFLVGLALLLALVGMRSLRRA
jgi:hypothetical protein